MGVSLPFREGYTSSRESVNEVAVSQTERRRNSSAFNGHRFTTLPGQLVLQVSSLESAGVAGAVLLRHDAACFAWQMLGVSDWIEDSRSVSGSSTNAEIFDVFLCHNSEDKPAVREIAQKLSEQNIKPWLDEADIRAGSSWHTAFGQQIETVKSAAVFVGQHGVGPWQDREIIALLDQFDKRGCPVIPVILPSAIWSQQRGAFPALPGHR